jgi:hypothetical protein
MKTAVITLWFVLLSQLVPAQSKTEIYFGESGRNDYANDIIESYDKGYLVSAGYEWEFGWDIKTDINLELLWDNDFEFPGFAVYNTASVMDSLGNYYICGSTMGWPFVTKMNSCRQKQWCKILKYEADFNFGWSDDIVISKNNEIVLLVSLSSDELIDKVHLIGLNENGDVLWKKPYASKNVYPLIDNPSGYSIKEIDNEYYISGYCYWPYPDDPDHVFLRPLFIGIDSLFNEKWILPFYALDSVYGVAFNTIAISDTVLMGVGYRLGDYNKNSILMFFNTDGEELGYNQISNEAIGSNVDFNAIRDIERVNDSLFISPYYIGIGGELYFGEFVYDTSGTIFNNETRGIYKGTSSILKTSDNNFVIEIEVAEGKSDNDIYVYKIDENLNDVPFDPTPHNYDSLCPGGIQSGTIDLSDCLVWTDISEAPGPAEYYESIKQIPITAYPNPASKGSITFEFENTEHHHNIELKCFDLYGEEIFSKKVYRYQAQAVVDLTGLKQGMYVAVVYSGGLPVGECKFVIQ